MHIIISRALEGRVAVRQPPLLRSRIDTVARHHVKAARLQGRDTLRHDERLARKVLRNILHPLMMVIEPYHVDGSTLEEMVLRVGLITASRNRSRSPRIILLDYLGKVPGKERIHAQLIAMRQRRSIMPCIQNQIRLLQRKRICRSIRPLLQHLVADAPHDDARMIAVALHQVREVALVPFIKESGVVAIGFLASPHVETLVHDEDSHRIAHVEEFRSRRIMAASDGIHAHAAQDGKLAMHRILVYGSTQTAEIMMLADSIQLDTPAIEEKSLSGIKLHITEACSGCGYIHHLPV